MNAKTNEIAIFALDDRVIDRIAEAVRARPLGTQLPKPIQMDVNGASWYWTRIEDFGDYRNSSLTAIVKGLLTSSPDTGLGEMVTLDADLKRSDPHAIIKFTSR